MKDLPGMHGNPGGLVLRLGQFFFSVAVLVVMATTSELPSVIAFGGREWKDKGGREGWGSGELGTGVAKEGLEGGNGGSYSGEGKKLGVVEGRQLGKEVGVAGKTFERRE
ncbi:CASP-like protein [Pyrus ussuriensis x Pyrus communis]|uniref:CASP-like protein n=1 Tax=Pyrus ussuriensis x Pyrus communis TaxID=2448454 RepID=A0A5N5FWG2_9ROSA|nr:CASP-like protein [Pyrus ussuriensis x Pyrus communis]